MGNLLCCKSSADHDDNIYHDRSRGRSTSPRGIHSPRGDQPAVVNARQKASAAGSRMANYAGGAESCWKSGDKAQAHVLSGKKKRGS